MLQVRWFVGTIGLVGVCAALACSGTDPVEGSSPKATGGAPAISGSGGAPAISGMGGAPAISGMGGAPGKTCGAMKVPAGCANATAALAPCKACHDAEGIKAFKTLDFFTDPKGALLGKPGLYTTYTPVAGLIAGCPATKEVLLDPNNFDTSLFVTKTRGTGFACGDKMPQIGTNTQAERDCIVAWACGLIP